MTAGDRPGGAHPSSFRDPAGFVFRRAGVVYRQVNRSGRDAYDRLMNSGLYRELVDGGLLIPHTEVGPEHALTPEADVILHPAPIPFISYPYEWCFGQLKDAALLTLDVQARALARGLSLKDASAYNVQFLAGRPVLIDTLSFEPVPPGRPWVAYRQFCQHFLAPLALAARRDIRLQQLLRIYPDGIPLSLASALLPARTRLEWGLLAHLHGHAQAERRLSELPVPARSGSTGRAALLGLVDSLRASVERLHWRPSGTPWLDYYATSSYTPDALHQKADVVAAILDRLDPPPASAWDLGSNTGRFSRLASERGIFTLSLDADPAAVEENYRQVRAGTETRLLPLLVDLTNPSPGLGWANQERDSLAARGPAGVVMALALVHHLAIANNLPLSRVANFLAGLGRELIVEFVPKEDPQVQRLLRYRDDIFDGYYGAGFEAEFGRAFNIRGAWPIAGSGRIVYWMSALGATA